MAYDLMTCLLSPARSPDLVIPFVRTNSIAIPFFPEANVSIPRKVWLTETLQCDGYTVLGGRVRMSPPVDVSGG